MATFDELVAQALDAPFSGRDFSWLAARVVTWAIPEDSLDACAARLRTAHDTPAMWPVLVRQRRFLLVAVKP